MFVVSGGMQKSGSTLLHVYAMDLICRQHGSTGQRAFETWVREGPVGGSGSFPWKGWVDHVADLETLAATHGPFVLKTHLPFTEIRQKLAGREIRAIFSYRDPRDAVLSALDHGARSRAAGDWPYAGCVDLAATLPVVREWCEAAVTWLDAPGVLRFRYEDLIEKTIEQVQRLAEFLGVSDPRSAAEAAVQEERSQRAPGKNQFNTGLAHRWLTEMTPDEVDLCEKVLGGYITAMGYTLRGGRCHPESVSR
jgi:hypothetical protein